MKSPNGYVFLPKFPQDSIIGQSCLLDAAPKLLEQLIHTTQQRLIKGRYKTDEELPEDLKQAIELIATANGWRIQ